MSGPRIKVLVVEGDPAVRQGIMRLLGLHPMIEVVAGALNGRTAFPKIGSYRPDCILVDVATAADDALALLEQLAGNPEMRCLAMAQGELAGGVEERAMELTGSGVVRSASPLTSEAAVEAFVQELAQGVLRQGRGALASGPTQSPAATIEVMAHPRAAPVPAQAPAPAPAPPPTLSPPPPAPSPPPPPPPSAAPAPAVVPSVAPPAVARPRSRPAAVAPTPTAVAVAAVPAAPLQLARLEPCAKVPRVLGIGVSTGGPKTLAELCPRLPADFPLPIVLVQHMPPKFTASLAESLDRVCKLRVKEAAEGDRIERGRILIAPGGSHLRVTGTELGEVARLTLDPPECSCRPSVDYLFRSLVDTYGPRVLGVVLTGMGEDGWIGSRLIHAAGGRVLAQHESTCTVYGMPRGPIEAGIATAVMLEQMADAIVQLARGTSCS